jgi:hypothetical protein
MTCTVQSFQKREKRNDMPFFYHIRYFLSCPSSCVPWTKQAIRRFNWVGFYLFEKQTVAISYRSPRNSSVNPIYSRSGLLADLYCIVHACVLTVLVSALTLLRLLTAAYGRSCSVPEQRLPCVQYKDGHMISLLLYFCFGKKGSSTKRNIPVSFLKKEKKRKERIT